MQEVETQTLWTAVVNDGLPSFNNGPPPSDNGPPPSDNGPPPSDNGPPPSDNGPPPSDNGPPPSDNGPSTPYSPSANIPPSDSGPLPDDGPPTSASYVNVPSPRCTKRRVVESYEYVDQTRVEHPALFAHPSTGPGYGVVGKPKVLSSGDGYMYVSTREAVLNDLSREECAQCLQYRQIIDQSQSNSAGLASSYSKILAQLNRAQTLLTRLEDTIKEELATGGGGGGGGRGLHSSPTLVSSDYDLAATGGARVTKRSNTMMLGTIMLGSTGSLNNGGGGSPAATTSADKTMVTNMYPEAEDAYSLSPECRKQLASLASHLGKAVDICQMSAAALFKRGGLTPPQHRKITTSSSVHYSSLASKRQKPPLVRLCTQPEVQVPRPCPLPLVRESSLTMDTEDKDPTLVTDEKKDCGSSNEKSGFDSDGKLSNEEKGQDRGGKPGGEKAGDTSDDEPKHDVRRDSDMSGDKPNGGGASTGGAATSVVFPNPNKSSKKPYVSHMMALMEKEEQACTDFCMVDLPQEEITTSLEEMTHTPDQTTDDKDFKQAMSKIADMEEERRALLEEIELLQQDNVQVRFSLSDALSALENKELQLVLAMQDMTLAIQEVKKAAEMRVELQKLKLNRDQILHKYRALEDDHAAVKYSLLQQLRQRSNNKAEVSSDYVTHPRGDISTEMEEDKDTIYKQGYLIKQGGLVKTWKRRLFVLDNEGLSYYKTEQPVQVVTLNKISKVEHTREVSAQHRFEVYTSDRVFRLVAPSHKEMQSWVGILQTLKDRRHATAPTKTDSRPKAHLGVSPKMPGKNLKLPSQDSQDSDQDVSYSVKASTLPPTNPKEEPLSPPPDTPGMSFQQLKADDEKDENPPPTKSFSLPAPNHFTDDDSYKMRSYW